MTSAPTKLLTVVAQYDIVPWSGRNTSGIKPRWDKVLIFPDQASSQVNGVYLTPETIERHAEAAETGTIVAVGPDAWKWNGDRSRRSEDPPMKPGERCIFERYAGQKQRGRDGLWYRMMDDKCIGGEWVEPDGEPVAEAGPAAHVTEAHALQDAIARGYATDEELPEIEAPPLVPVDLGPSAVSLEARAIVEAKAAEPPPVGPLRSDAVDPKSFPVYLTRNGQLMMAYSLDEMLAKAGKSWWYGTAEEAQRAYTQSAAAHVEELVRVIKAS